MLSQTSFKKLASQLHTSELNVMREYLQHVLLSYIYQQPESDGLAFKGGTALRILFGSPRFSEDLDFSSNLNGYQVKHLLEKTWGEVKKESLLGKIEELKETSGGYFARLLFELYGQLAPIEFNISLRNRIKTQPMLVTSPFVPSYQCMVLPTQQLVSEKIEALLRRKKPRDYFDLYFLLRSRLGIEVLISFKKKLQGQLQEIDSSILKRELKLFLPLTHQSILKDFLPSIQTELNRL